MRRSVFLSCLDSKYEDGISLTLIVDAVETAVLAFDLKILKVCLFFFTYSLQPSTSIHSLVCEKANVGFRQTGH